MENDESKFKVLSFPKVENKTEDIIENLLEESFRLNRENFEKMVENTEKDSLESFIFCYTNKDGNMFVSSSAIHPKDLLFMIKICEQRLVLESMM